MSEIEDLRAQPAAVTAERDRQASRASCWERAARAEEADRLAAEQQRDTARALLAEAREYIKADAGMDEHYMILDRIDAALSAPEGR